MKTKIYPTISEDCFLLIVPEKNKASFGYKREYLDPNTNAIIIEKMKRFNCGDIVFSFLDSMCIETDKLIKEIKNLINSFINDLRIKNSKLYKPIVTTVTNLLNEYVHDNMIPESTYIIEIANILTTDIIRINKHYKYNYLEKDSINFDLMEDIEHIKLKLKIIVKRIKAIQCFYNSIINLIDDSKGFDYMSKEKQNNIINRYDKIKHFAFLYVLFLQEILDLTKVNDCINDPEKYYPERADEYLSEKIPIHSEIIAKNVYPHHELQLVKDFETIFAIDLYHLIFFHNDKVPFKTCPLCHRVYDKIMKKNPFCPECSYLHIKYQKDCEKYYDLISGILNMRLERAAISNNSTNEKKNGDEKNQFINLYKNIKKISIRKYGEYKGRKRTIDWLKKYHSNLKIKNTFKGEKNNAQNDETLERDRHDHEGEREKMEAI